MKERSNPQQYFEINGNIKLPLNSTNLTKDRDFFKKPQFGAKTFSRNQISSSHRTVLSAIWVIFSEFLIFYNLTFAK